MKKLPAHGTGKRKSRQEEQKQGKVVIQTSDPANKNN